MSGQAIELAGRHERDIVHPAMSSARTLAGARPRRHSLWRSAVGASAAAWVGLLFQAQMPMVGTGVAEGVTFLAAWGVMMAAMMLPSAVPMISLYGVLHRKPSSSTPAGIPTAVFALIYLLMWLAFGVPVYVASVIVGSQMGLADVLPYALAVVLVASGVYQLTPLKRACLQACRSPLGFLLAAVAPATAERPPGTGACRLLHWLLLGVDGSARGRGCDVTAMGVADRSCGFHREAAARRRVDGARRRRRVDPARRGGRGESGRCHVVATIIRHVTNHLRKGVVDGLANSRRIFRDLQLRLRLPVHLEQSDGTADPGVVCCRARPAH